jgi:hypothetical protein
MDMAVPGQMVLSVALTVITGSGVTLMVLFAVLLHPAALVPVTVYVVVVVGETVIAAVDCPELQL